jgi:hypothetical protein
MEKALAAERHPVWQRSCPQMNDIDFIRYGLLRSISAVDSGRHFIQTTEEVHGELLPHSQLLTKEGRYFQMWQHQKGEFLGE